MNISSKLYAAVLRSVILWETTAKMAAGRKSDRNFFSISGYLAFNENGLQPIYDEPEEEAAENNEFLKRLKPAKQNFMVWLPTIYSW